MNPNKCNHFGWWDSLKELLGHIDIKYEKYWNETKCTCVQNYRNIHGLSNEVKMEGSCVPCQLLYPVINENWGSKQNNGNYIHWLLDKLSQGNNIGEAMQNQGHYRLIIVIDIFPDLSFRTAH